MYTEEQAKKKKCPLRTHNQIIDDGSSYVKNVEVNTPCMTSECMMWRWEKRPEFRLDPTIERFNAQAEKLNEIRIDPKGYCGLAK